MSGSGSGPSGVANSPVIEKQHASNIIRELRLAIQSFPQKHSALSCHLAASHGWTHAGRTFLLVRLSLFLPVAISLVWPFPESAPFASSSSWLAIALLLSFPPPSDLHFFDQICRKTPRLATIDTRAFE